MKGELWAGQGRWALGSVAVGVGQAWAMHVVIKGSHLLNAAAMRPIFVLGSIGWLIGLWLGFLGLRAQHQAARITAMIGLVGNLTGLVLIWVSYAKWWVS